MKKTESREGFSLIELIIAIAIVAIVMSSVLLIVTYSTNNMRRTSNTVYLQNQAKDAMTHITTQIQEGTDAAWLTDQNILVVIAEHEQLNGYVDYAKVGFYQFEASDKTIYYSQKYLVLYDTSESECADAITKLSLTDESDFARLQSSVYKKKRKIDYDEVYNALSSKLTVAEDYKLVENVLRFSNEPDPTKAAASVSGVAVSGVAVSGVAADIDDITGKTIPVYITMENETKEAQFYSVKKIYLRNQ